MLAWAAALPAQVQPGAAPVPQKPPPATAPGDKDPAQDPPWMDPSLRRLQGRKVREIRVAQERDGKTASVSEEVADRVLRGLLTRSGQPLESAKVSTDLNNLWLERRLRTDCRALPVGDEVVLTFVILDEDQVFERVEFRGLKNLEKTEVTELLGLYPDRQVTTSEALAMRNVLVARYKRAGYAFCSVGLDESEPEGGTAGDRPRKVLTLAVDEGPKVTVRSVRFRGNAAFPGDPPFGFLSPGDFLTRSAHMQSTGGTFLSSGEPYSREIVEEDLDRLRLFYRGKGFLDAEVELVDPQWSRDRTEVDLEFRVVEGPRYRIRSLKVVHVDDQGRPLPAGQARYRAEEVAAELKVQPGDFYDHDRIRRDLRLVQDFYGKRGHPARRYYSRNITDAFFIPGDWPQESYTADAQVDLTVQVCEGKPKTLRDVLIRGNTGTRDRVIRRKIYVFPGDRIDMAQVDRSIRYLERTRYFQDQVTLAGPRFELLPTDTGLDQVDLAIDLKEGETGEFRWGIGISTGAGAQANFTFNKRNFDLWNPPSSANPVTVISEVADGKAFHGGGQQLELQIAPGTEISYFQVGWTEPDIFRSHFDTWELRLNGWRRVRRFRDGYSTDTLGANVGLARRFSEEFSLGVTFREESVEVKNLAAEAPGIVWDSRGTTELRGARLSGNYTDCDDPARPTSGFSLDASAELIGGPFGAEADFVKGTAGANLYLPVHETESGHRHVLHLKSMLGAAEPFGQSDVVFLTERFYLGGPNLRGFDFRGAGPSQFGHAILGEAILTTSLEYTFPLVQTRLERELKDRELLRGVLFADYGQLGLGIDHPSFREPRLSVGFGIRIEVPVLELPIAIDLGWPLLYEETDSRRQLFFNISR